MPLFAELLRPFGEIVAIDEDPDMDLRVLKTKSVAWHWESMFTRGIFETPDMIGQHDLLDEAATLFESGALGNDHDPRDPGHRCASLREAHGIVASGTAIGKVVLSR